MSARIPLEEARNLGPVTASEMQALGWTHLDQLVELGWEDVCIQYCEMYPHRLNLNAFTAIIGAIEDQHWQDVDPALKAEARKLLNKLKSGF